jgi:hypothetical protein
MQFLCVNHRETYRDKSDDQLSQHWVEWMYTAGVYYEAGEWRRALPFAGSAFDLARMRLQRRVPQHQEVLAQVAVAGIYVANVFDHLCQDAEARHIRWLASECLSVVQPHLSMSVKAECSTCRRYLHDLERQACFVHHYLNIPFEAVSQAVARVLH